MSGKPSVWADRAEEMLFRNRLLVLIAFGLTTFGMLYAALQTRVDAGFKKQLPLGHEYIQTFLEYQDEFGGANRILFALTVPEGDIFTPTFFELLRELTDETYFIPGIDRTQVTSIWTPNVRFIEIVEDGFSGGNIVPPTFAATPDDFRLIRENIIKSGYLGQLVANDFSGAAISAQLQDVDPGSGERLDYLRVARHLELLRERFEQEGEGIGLRIHIIGFAKVIGDISEGATHVIFFFFVSLAILALFVRIYAQSWRLAGLTLGSALAGVIWQLGLLNLMGFGIDPMSILVPFLVLAIGVSHGVQMVRSFRDACFDGMDQVKAARRSFRQLLKPGATALVTDMIGFITILAIRIPIIQELAITASIGVFTLLFTNLVLLPILLSHVKLRPDLHRLMALRRERMDPFWKWLASTSRPVPSICILSLCAVGGALAFQRAMQVQIGDLDHGVPELRESSRYNQDSRMITSRFNIGVNLISVLAESAPNSVIDWEVMAYVDRFAWHMQNTPGVQSVTALPLLAKTINSGWNEGNPKWYSLPRHPATLSQAISPVDTSSGLLNADGSVIPVLIYLPDHRAETIVGVVQAVKDFRQANPAPGVELRLASGNVGVMGATNEVVASAQFPMLLYVFGAVILICLAAFRSWRPAFCIVTPLALVSILAYALMYSLGIGLKVSTLPVVALGVGVGVDYGIYLFSRLNAFLEDGIPFADALLESLRLTGSAVLFTGLTLGFGVSTWLFSELKFQADMGILLTFMFLCNMLGALILLPSLARWLYLPPSTRLDPAGIRPALDETRG